MPNYTFYYRPKSELGEAQSTALVSAILRYNESGNFYDGTATVLEIAGEHSDPTWIGEQFSFIGTDFIHESYEGISSRKRLEEAFKTALLPEGFVVRVLCENELTNTGDSN